MSKSLHAAAFEGDTATVAWMLADGQDPNAPGDQNYSALHEAAQSGHQDIIRLLLAAGANSDAQDDYKCTALHEAARYGHAQICQDLLDAGVPVDVKGFENRTPLHYAAMQANLGAMDVLIKAGANVDAPTLYQAKGDELRRYLSGATPLHMACSEGSILGKDKPTQAYVDAATKLLDAGADVNASERCITSGLAFIDINIDHNVRKSWDVRPIHMAKSAEMVNCLAAHDAKLDGGVEWSCKLYPGSKHIDYGSPSPIRLMVANGHEEAAIALLGNGAELDAKDKAVITPSLVADMEDRLLKQATLAAGSWSPDPKEADAQFDRRFAEASAQSQGVEHHQQQARVRMRL